MNNSQVLDNDLKMVGKGSKINTFKSKPVWPPGIGEALVAIGGEGIHNITARRLIHSPEVKDFPHTEFGVPILTEMTEEQKMRFYKLLGR